MKRRSLAIAQLVTLLLLLACGGSAQRNALEAEIAGLRAQRDKLVKIAEHLDEYKTEVARLQEDLARVEALGMSLSHEERVKKAVAFPNVTSKRTTSYMPPNVPWEISGTTEESFTALRKEVGFLAVERAEFTPPAWKITLPAYDYTEPFTRPTSTSPNPYAASTPAPGRFETKRTRALRAEVDALRKEIAELERLVGEVGIFESKKAELERALGVLDTPTRLTGVSRLAGPLFFADGRICKSGTIVLTTQAIRFWCAPAGDAEAAAQSIRTRVAGEIAPNRPRTAEDSLPAFRGWRLGTVSIDESATESVQATLVPEPAP